VLRRHAEDVPQLSTAEWLDLHQQLAHTTHALALAFALTISTTHSSKIRTDMCIAMSLLATPPCVPSLDSRSRTRTIRATTLSQHPRANSHQMSYPTSLNTCARSSSRRAQIGRRSSGSTAG
jgi:hypothetical protein